MIYSLLKNFMLAAALYCIGEVAFLITAISVKYRIASIESTGSKTVMNEGIVLVIKIQYIPDLWMYKVFSEPVVVIMLESNACTAIQCYYSAICMGPCIIQGPMQISIVLKRIIGLTVDQARL